jgi:hypothetical protein
MYKKTVEYEDFNGDKVVEDLYFNLSKAEIMELNFHLEGGLMNYAKSIINARDSEALADLFKELLLKSYGEKTPDGKHFMKSEQIRKEFECSIPYDILYVTLSTDDVQAAEFFNGIVPKDLREGYEKMEKEGNLPKITPGN